MVEPVIVAISMGGGLQTTALALMAAHGEVGPMPDCAIFADTRNEKRATYAYLEWLAPRLPFPIVTVRRFDRSLGDATTAHYRAEPGGKPFTPPFYSPQGKLPTFCSKEWKTRAVIGELRRMIGVGAGERVPKDAAAQVWLGITVDESHRMAPCEARWITNRWPLIERRKRRQECATWLERHGYPLPPRSACVFCPHQGDDEYREMPAHDFAEACTFDDAIRGGGNGTSGPLYVHRSMMPLRDVDFSSAPDGQLSLFGEECRGVCGV